LGLYRACLAAIVIMLSLADFAFAARPGACLACHPPHYSGEGSCVSCHKGNDRSRRKEIAHDDLIAGRFSHYALGGSQVVKSGKKLLEGLACRRCHRSEKKGNRLAGNLDVTGATRKAGDIYDSIRAPALFMPDFHLRDAQIASLVNAILAQAKLEKPPAAEIPLVIHFTNIKLRFADARNIRKNVFAEKCGPCHKILSEKAGGLGSGYVGPNLSGLFSEFYPRTYRDVESWTPDKLKKWLKNPRDIRTNAVMQPVRFEPGEFEQLPGFIQVEKSPPSAPR